MDRELLPGLLVDGSGAHASVRPGLTAMVLSPPKGTDLSGIRTLTLPESMESFAGIEKFRNLRLIRYDGKFWRVLRTYTRNQTIELTVQEEVP